MDWLKKKIKSEKAAPTGRGKVESKEESIELLRTKLEDLPKEGKEAFFRYLRRDKYPEDKDICDIDVNADGMNEWSRKYQFWLQCEQVEHYARLFEGCVLNDEDRFSEVNECYDPNTDGTFGDFLNKKKTDTESSKSFATKLKDKIKPKLNTKYDEFKDSLRERFKD